MIPRTDRVAAVAAPLLCAALVLLAACGGARESTPAAGGGAAPDAPSHAADALIEKAKSPEERRALERARDDVDREMREKVRALEAEIARLEKENQSLRRAAK